MASDGKQMCHYHSSLDAHNSPRLTFVYSSHWLYNVAKLGKSTFSTRFEDHLYYLIIRLQWQYIFLARSYHTGACRYGTKHSIESYKWKFTLRTRAIFDWSFYHSSRCTIPRVSWTTGCILYLEWYSRQCEFILYRSHLNIKHFLSISNWRADQVKVQSPGQSSTWMQRTPTEEHSDSKDRHGGVVTPSTTFHSPCFDTYIGLLVLPRRWYI